MLVLRISMSLVLVPVDRTEANDPPFQPDLTHRAGKGDRIVADVIKLEGTRIAVAHQHVGLVGVARKVAKAGHRPFQPDLTHARGEGDGVVADNRFFSNERVNERDILSGHFQATHDRFTASGGPVLVMHDTTEFSFQRERMQPIGITHKVSNRRAKRGRPRNHTICGILMHSSLAVTPEGLPLGLTAIKFWNRKKFKGCDALKKKINPTRVPIEKKESIRWLENLRHATATLGDPVRCIHIGDRESDIYELFCAAQEIGTHFLVRTCVDRLAGDGGHTVAADMAKAKVRGQHRFE